MCTCTCVLLPYIMSHQHLRSPIAKPKCTNAPPGLNTVLFCWHSHARYFNEPYLFKDSRNKSKMFLTIGFTKSRCINFITFIYCSLCVGVHMCHIHVEIRGQLAGNDCLLLSCGSSELVNTPLSTEPSYQYSNCFLCFPDKEQKFLLNN